MAYILSLLREPAASGNDSTVMEDEEDESDVEDGDITMFNSEVTTPQHLNDAFKNILTFLPVFKMPQNQTPVQCSHSCLSL